MKWHTKPIQSNVPSKTDWKRFELILFSKTYFLYISLNPYFNHFVSNWFFEAFLGFNFALHFRNLSVLGSKVLNWSNFFSIFMRFDFVFYDLNLSEFGGGRRGRGRVQSTFHSWFFQTLKKNSRHLKQNILLFNKLGRDIFC